jgi:LytS/YehU family sensor histidine kinase
MAALAVLVYRFEGRFPLSGPRWLRHLPVHVPAVVVFSALHTLGMVGIRKVVYAMAGRYYDFGDAWLGFAYELQKDLISYAIIVIACIALRTQRQRRERELAVIRLERDLSEARLAQLTAQIEPHFMFNTLNAISNRMHEDVDAADRMMAAFAELLRAALAESGSAHVRVAEDVAWLERYFALMRERFRGKLETKVTLDPAARDARIPRLLLQPLVENAFEHGLKNGRGSVAVAIRVDGRRLRCSVEDDGAGLAAEFRSGTGLGNVRSRLDLLYPQDHAFRIASRPEGGTRIEIDLPLAVDG